MGYFVRALCTSAQAPTLAEVQQWLGKKDSRAVIEDAEMDSSEWEAAALSYRPGKLPILVECNRDEGEGSLLQEELQEFAEFIGDADDSPGKARVAAHLAKTRFIVACQLPTSDIDEDGYDANDAFLAFFEEHCGAILQADGEGFYAGKELVLALD